ncbi:MAG: phosphate transport system regulatory protein PhoU, partial [Pirellulaceae bacterium]|nr:phosphate transport system regulatory protein PhoU [Pirellulaceae bacterium]
LMVRDALDACVEADAAKAKNVIQLDDEVDAYNRIVIDQLIGMMKEDVDQIEPAVHCFSASRHLERIGDLAENIAEEVVYLVDGDIIRHQHGLFVDTPSTSTE